MSGSRQPCDYAHLPHAYTYARPYLTGLRCARHTPAALNGRPESPPGPGWPLHREPPDAEAADAAAVPDGSERREEPTP
ncbi:hypothetical protein AB0I84_06095 [Streptomyces spectabilis]|uniref:hypothetical protein n=1 Tax=Streptomyces spectabilis TaxID=68270 RepID=UPI0033DC1E54